MSDTTKSTVEAKPGEPATPPRTIKLAIAAICVQLSFALMYAVSEWPLGAELRRSLIDTNKGKKTPTPLCGNRPGKGCLDAAKSVRALQIETTLGTVLVAIAIALFVRRIRRGIRSGRTGYTAISLISVVVGFAGSPLSIMAVTYSGPVLLRAFSVLAGAAALAAIVALFLPESTRFLPKPVRGRGGGLFAPRPRKPLPPTGLRSSAASRAADPAATKGSASGARAKDRTDEAAIARGAALARSRAKASKSRRTEL